MRSRRFSTEGSPTADDQKDQRDDPAQRWQGIHPSKNAEGELRDEIQSLGGPKADPDMPDPEDVMAPRPGALEGEETGDVKPN